MTQAQLSTVSTGASASQSVIVFPEGVQGLLVPLGPNVIARTFRQGDDLVIVYQDGRQVQIAGFFDTGDRVLVAQDPESGDLFEVSLAPDGSLIGVEPRSVADIAELLGATQEEVEALSAAHGADADAGFADSDHVTLSTQSGVELAAINPGLVAAGILGAGAIAAIATSSGGSSSKSDGNNPTPTPDTTSTETTDPGTTPAQGPGGGDADSDAATVTAIDRENALGDIAAYAEDQGNTAPTVDTYATAGVTGVTADNLAAVNARVAGVAREGADTVSELDALVTLANGDVAAAAAAATALGTIVAYADDQSNPAPTVDTYTTAGVTGVTAANLAAVNARVAGADREGADTVAELDALVTLANGDVAAAAAAATALGTIVAYADDQSNTEPTAATYTTAGVAGVTDVNLAAVNARVAGADREGADTVAELDALVTLANGDVAAAAAAATALGTIVAYADDQSNTEPTVDTYTTAGVAGVTDANLAAVNAAIATGGSSAFVPDTLVEPTVFVQGVVNRVISSSETGDGENQTSPTDTTSTETPDGTGDGDVGGNADAAVAAATALGTIADYADDDANNPAPTAATYATAGVTGVTAANLAAVNARVAAADREGADTVAEVDALVQQANGDVDAAAAAATALGTIVAYADDQSNTEPTVDTYTTAGVTGVTDVNLAAVNARVAGADREGADTVSELDALVTLANGDVAAAAAAATALGTIVAYADDQSNTEPTVDTYTTAGVAGVTDVNLAAVNARVAGVAREDADEVAELDALVTLANGDVAAAAAAATALGTIVAYADDQSNTEPTVDTYTTAGVTGVTDANLAAVNARVAGADREGADTVAELDALVTLANGDVAAAAAAATALGTIVAYADDQSNTEPTVDTYTTAGVAGVTDVNLAAVNARVAGVAREGADTVSELDALVTLANGDVAAAAAAATALGAIADYADDDANNPAPTAATYATAGVTGVTDANLAAVNARVAGADREGADTVAELDALVTLANGDVAAAAAAATALGTIVAYADDQSNTEPTVDTYTTAGVTGVTDVNLAAVNARVAGADRAGPTKCPNWMRWLRWPTRMLRRQRRHWMQQRLRQQHWGPSWPMPMIRAILSRRLIPTPRQVWPV
ncbi:hypothetical protein [Ruegeria sp.]|uniref:hypothetical protein n=1 Tax=Ruegeria sp. TaxID=1879320 RepID=UPI003B00EEBF